MKDAVFYIKVPVDTKYVTTDGKGRIVAWTGDMPVYNKKQYQWIGVESVFVMKFNREDWYKPKIVYVWHMVSSKGALKISVKVPDGAKFITCSSFGNVRAWLTSPLYFPSGVWVSFTGEEPFDVCTTKKISADKTRGQIIELED